MNKPAKVIPITRNDTIEALAEAISKVVGDSDFIGDGEIHIVISGEGYEVEYHEYDPDDDECDEEGDDE